MDNALHSLGGEVDGVLPTDLAQSAKENSIKSGDNFAAATTSGVSGESSEPDSMEVVLLTDGGESAASTTTTSDEKEHPSEPAAATGQPSLPTEGTVARSPPPPTATAVPIATATSATTASASGAAAAPLAAVTATEVSTPFLGAGGAAPTPTAITVMTPPEPPTPAPEPTADPRATRAVVATSAVSFTLPPTLPSLPPASSSPLLATRSGRMTRPPNKLLLSYGGATRATTATSTTSATSATRAAAAAAAAAATATATPIPAPAPAPAPAAAGVRGGEGPNPNPNRRSHHKKGERKKRKHPTSPNEGATERCVARLGTGDAAMAAHRGGAGPVTGSGRVGSGVSVASGAASGGATGRTSPGVGYRASAPLTISTTAIDVGAGQARKGREGKGGGGGERVHKYAYKGWLSPRTGGGALSGSGMGGVAVGPGVVKTAVVLRGAEKRPKGLGKDAEDTIKSYKRAFDEVIWPGLLARGWTHDLGSRPNDNYFLPPGIIRGSKFRTRVDYFDSSKQVMHYLLNETNEPKHVDLLEQAWAFQAAKPRPLSSRGSGG
ncbi:unnamed protein product, partial [Discosporangium mesarthrocarpum]